MRERECVCVCVRMCVYVLCVLTEFVICNWAGIGAKQLTTDETWLAATSMYNDLLQRLAQSGNLCDRVMQYDVALFRAILSCWISHHMPGCVCCLSSPRALFCTCPL